MVTQFHTLLHFVTQNHTILPLTASLAASTRIQGVSKSHLLGIISDYAERFLPYTHVYTHMHNLQQRGLCVRIPLDLCVYGSLSSVTDL